MDYILLFFGFLLVVGGVIGSFLPVIPGPPTSWVGLLLLHLTKAVETDWLFLSITLSIAVFVTIVDYFIPIIGVKKFGGSKYGVWGSTIGLLVGLFFTPVGMVLGLFIGAFLGEVIYDGKNLQKSLKASLGAVLGFLLSTGIKLIVCIVFAVYFVKHFMMYQSSFLM